MHAPLRTLLIVGAFIAVAVQAAADSWTMTVTYDPGMSPPYMCDIQFTPSSGSGYASFSAQEASAKAAQSMALIRAKAFFRSSMALTDAIAMEYYGSALP